MKKICIDCRFFGIKHTGIGRYVEELIKNLPSEKNIEILLIVNQKDETNPALSNFKKFTTKYHPYSLISQFEIAVILYKINPNILHVPHFTVPLFWFGKKIVTIHDLIKHQSVGINTTTHNPVFYYLKLLGYKFVVWNAIHKSVHIITPTNYWKDELINKYKISPEKISVTYEGVTAL